MFRNLIRSRRAERACILKQKSKKEPKRHATFELKGGAPDGKRPASPAPLWHVVHFHQANAGRVPCPAHDGGVVAGGDGFDQG